MYAQLESLANGLAYELDRVKLYNDPVTKDHFCRVLTNTQTELRKLSVEVGSEYVHRDELASNDDVIYALEAEIEELKAELAKPKETQE